MYHLSATLHISFNLPAPLNPPSPNPELWPHNQRLPKWIWDLLYKRNFIILYVWFKTRIEEVLDPSGEPKVDI